MYNNTRGQFGEISHQASVVIQCTHDKKDMMDRMMVKKEDGKNYIVYGTPTLDMATCRIDRGDLVFQVGTSAMPRGNILNGAPPVTSFLNGMYVRRPGVSPDFSLLPYDKRVKSEEEYNASKVSEAIRFIGVSLGSTVPNPEDQADQKTQITVRTQGTMAIHHNGRVNLHPGDTLLWRVPTTEEIEAMKKRFGRAHNKITLMTVPMRREHENLDESIMKRVKDAGQSDPYKAREALVAGNTYEVGVFADEVRRALTACFAKGAGATGRFRDILAALDPLKGNFDTSIDGLNGYDAHDVMQQFDKALDDAEGKFLINSLVTSFIRLMLDLERRKIGKVLSYAKPGDKVDVLLGSG
jgi:hypothetical protein